MMGLTSLVLLGSCTVSKAHESTSGGVDLTGVMVLESAAGCRFDANTAHALDGVLLSDFGAPEMSHAKRVFVGDLELAPEVVREVDDGEFAVITHTGRAAFPDGTRWHGLTPLALHSYYVSPPETDHYQERGIVFADSPQRLHDALEAMGEPVPLSPGALELTEYGPFWGAGCGSSIEVRAEGSGSILSCGYGC